MIYVYAGIFLVMIVLIFIFRLYKKNLLSGLDKKEHPLKFLYPFAGRCLDFLRKIFPGKKGTKVEWMLKQLYVKENIETEKYIYNVRKISYGILILLAVTLMGTAICYTKEKIQTLDQLERNGPGGGSEKYPVQITYDGKTENIDLEIEERKYSEEEIAEIFDQVSEEIKKEILGKNESIDKINQPLNLISEYQNVKIYWEIEDLDHISYNGDICVDNVDNQGILVNLYATLTLGDSKRTERIPVSLIPEEQSEKDILLEEIQKSIKESNSIYESEVELPKTINDKPIQFAKAKENKDAAVLLLALIGLAALMGFYDKNLEDKIRKRSEEMMMDFTEIVSKLCLLYDAGLSILKAWERIVEDYEKKERKRFAYQEMKLVLEKIKNGENEREAISEFGKRCGLHSYIKLANLLEQNLTLGSKGMRQNLTAEVKEAFEERKRLARKKGEEASTKLLVPMVMMLVVVILIIAVPALMSMSF